MGDAAAVLANPIVAFGLRAALGAYIVYMARGFYADPTAYFRRWMPRLEVPVWAQRVIRWAAGFCIWGGCFIVAAALATQIFGLHGWPLAAALVVIAAIAAYFLLPANVHPISEGESGSSRMRMK